MLPPLSTLPFVDEDLASTAEPITAKRRKIVPPPLLQQSVRLCTYCGINLERRHKGGNAPLNTKNQFHLVMEHATDVALDMQGSCMNVARVDFIKYVHSISMVKNKLKLRGFNVIPAANYFRAK